ncbi:type I-G CRISPR-associated protein Csb2 [Zobellella sp. An-6]|uniref:type I-G CRISPR-associated protein Csb2 n=1 Tax=Zobellella sp. An-6 TaxID=3400218 RepID=UPI004041F6D0
MTRILLISVRFHDDRYHGTGDWPPSPARLFQALVAAAALPGLDAPKCDALRWLEKLSAPTIAAPAAHSGQNVNLYVPNNDLDAKGGDIRRVAEIRSATKRIRPRLFDAAVPLLYIWRFDGNESQAKCICDIASGLYQLGRGVDMAWAVGELVNEAKVEEQLNDYPGAIYRPSQGGKSLRLDCPATGSLDSLETRHKANATRFHHVKDGRKVRTEFANAPKPHFRAVAYNSPATCLLFELRRTTAPGAPFMPWPLKSAAALVQRLRDGAQERLKTHFNGNDVVDNVLIGRNATEADKALRIRITPLPSIGHVHADRGIRRVLVEVPPDCPIRADDVAWGFSGLEITAPILDVETGEILSSPVELVPADDNSMLAHYGVAEERPAHLWRSVTPQALPENAKWRRIEPANRRGEAKGGQERADEQQHACHAVMQALRHAGLREKVVSIRVQREPFDAKGERAETFATATRFSKHHLWHVEIQFAEAVSGPLLLGNGRYCGLGLMAPVQQVEGVLAFSILDGLTSDVEPLQLARALRRAVMSRVQNELGTRENELSVFFTGHEADGSTARRGGHAHLAFVPDLARQRLLVIAPHVIEHREPFKGERDHLKTLALALAGLRELRAGRAGRLRLVRVEINLGADPLFAASEVWTATTPYTPTRHAKRNGRDSLYQDVLREVQRRQLPVPLAIEKKGADLFLRFMVAVPGPVLLGKTVHFGGGLFTCSMEDREHV